MVMYSPLGSYPSETTGGMVQPGVGVSSQITRGLRGDKVEPTGKRVLGGHCARVSGMDGKRFPELGRGAMARADLSCAEDAGSVV